jgi:hypothetical protein
MGTVNNDYPASKQKELTDAQIKAKAIAEFEAKQISESKTQTTNKFPTEIIQLPSKGKFYPKDHPLASGTVEMKYMTAKEEDILTNQSYIKQGVVLDKLFQSLLVTKFNYKDLLVGDKNAIMVAARILGYGKDYEFSTIAPSGVKQTVHVDLTQLSDKEIDWDQIKEGETEFELTLPVSKRVVTVQLLTGHIQKKIESEEKALTKLKKDASVTTMLKHIITSIDGNSETSAIRHFVDNELFANDSRYIRTEIKKITPDLKMEVTAVDEEDGDPFSCNLSIGLDFFWPDSKI